MPRYDSNEWPRSFRHTGESRYPSPLCLDAAYAGRTSERKHHLEAATSYIAAEHMLITILCVICSPYFHQLINTTPLTIMQALMMIRSVTRSTSRKNNAVRISENNGPVLLNGITTETLPRSNAW